MKTIKKLMTLVLSIAMVLAMGVTAFAEEPEQTYTITINNSATGHTYEAYQIFAGDLSDGKLTNVIWGSGVDITKIEESRKFNDAKSEAEALNNSNIKDFAKKIASYLSTQKENSTESAGLYTISGLTAGYYLVKDVNDSLKDNTGNAKDDFYTAYIMQVVGNVVATPKGDKPSVEKKVKENVKYTQNEGYGEGYNDVADYNIGDTVPFKLIGTVPDMSEYTSYKYIFHDTMSKGLTLDTNSIKVYVANDKVGTGKQDITSSFYKSSTQNEAGETIITVSRDNLKGISGVEKDKFIIVEYNATLNGEAEIGLPGNPNRVSLEYSNNPNQGGEGSTGKTPDDYVIVFTYKLDATKVDATDPDKKLEKAEFKLTNARENGKWAVLENGKVKEWVDSEERASVLTSDDNGNFSVTGLDAGTYYLKETKAPAGYNLPTDLFEIVITATTGNGQDWTSTKASDALTELTVNSVLGTGNIETGIASVTITNTQGSTLPSTGGMGTTIFYVVGTILVLAAVVLLITKKRMHADK